MTCPRCQGLIVREYWEERCLNCGHRTTFVPPPSAHYRPLPVEAPTTAVPTRVRLRAVADEKRREYFREWTRRRRAAEADALAQAEARREKKRVYMRDYMRAYNRRPGVREKANAAHRAWKRRTAAKKARAC